MRCCRNIEFKPNLKSFLQFKSTANALKSDDLRASHGTLFFVKTCCEFASPYDIIIIQIKLIGVSVYDEKQNT